MSEPGPQPRGEAGALTRRQFLTQAVTAMGAVITALVAVPVAGAFLDPVLKQAAGQANWVRLTAVAALSDSPTAFLLTAEKADGFMRQQVRANVYAFLEHGEPVALSNICTHLGCPVSWAADRQQYLCPCHGGVYDRLGKNIAGPPPRPLPRYATKVENGDLYIQVS